MLKRAIKTLNVIQEEMGLEWMPVIRAWQLNERHYGSLQGLNKAEMAVKFGDEQVKIWRRSYDVPPPALDVADERFPGRDPRYRDLADADVPRCESLKDTVSRFLPFWESDIAPALGQGKTVLVAAHGNSLRALVKYLDGISDDAIVGLNIPTGVPLAYDLDEALRPRSSRYLGDPDRVAAAAAWSTSNFTDNSG